MQFEDQTQMNPMFNKSSLPSTFMEIFEKSVIIFIHLRVRNATPVPEMLKLFKLVINPPESHRF
jgi:hypothetical protein